MKFAWILAAACLFCSSSEAQLRKCIAPDGKVTYSDVLCDGNTISERQVNPRGNTLDSSGFREQVQREQDAAAQTRLIERDRASEEAAKRQAQAHQQAQTDEATRQASMQSAKDSEAYGNCVRDVERQPATQQVKAELIAACRTAGYVQRQTGMSQGAVNDCVRSVERTGASGKDKARQLATCHGGDVKPEPPPPPRPRTSVIASCDAGGCWDDTGHRYSGQGSTLFRDDGKACQRVGNTVQCP
jgi:hypothetical protein